MDLRSGLDFETAGLEDQVVVAAALAHAAYCHLGGLRSRDATERTCWRDLSAYDDLSRRDSRSQVTGLAGSEQRNGNSDGDEIYGPSRSCNSRAAQMKVR